MKETPRILGTGNFVEQLLKETDGKTKHYLPAHEITKCALKSTIAQCEKDKININVEAT